MKKCKMKQLALALGVALGGMGLLPSAQAVHVSPDNLGQALIFPYYTVRGGWMTLFGITNTSSLVVAVKVRFREAYNSRDVFDFNIILSPYDTWTGWVTDAGDRPAIFTEHKSCTVGTITPTGIPFADGLNTYTETAADGGPTTPDRMKEGYIEAIMMGAANVATPAASPDLTPLARGAIHVAGATPTGCQALIDAFTTYSSLGTVGAAAAGGTLRGEFQLYEQDPNGVPLNPLKGTFALVNGPEGFNAVGLPVHLANFATPVGTAGAGALITSQLPLADANDTFTDSYNEPSLYLTGVRGGTSGVYLSSADAATPALNNTDGYGVTGALEASAFLNEWSRRNNAAAGWVTATDWVITLPTKNFHVDKDATNQFAGINNGRENVDTAPIEPFTQMFVDSTADPFVRRGKSCDSVSYTLRNREEQKSTAAGFSPGGTAQLCYETNVLTFNQGAILNSPIAKSIDYPENFTFGWLNVRFTGANAANLGLPAVGFAITTRDDQSSALLSEAGLYNHSFVRPVAAAQ